MCAAVWKTLALLAVFADGVFHATASEQYFEQYAPDRELACALRCDRLALSVQQHRYVGAFLIAGSVLAAVDLVLKPSFSDAAFWRFLMGVWWYVIVPITLTLIAVSTARKAHRLLKSNHGPLVCRQPSSVDVSPLVHSTLMTKYENYAVAPAPAAG